MKPFYSIIFAVMIAAGGASALEETPSTGYSTNPPLDMVQSAESIDTNAVDQMRDPFWPVGYSPVIKMVRPVTPSTQPRDEGPVAEDELKKALSMIRISGIIKRGEKCYASMNGMMVQAGDDIPIIVGGNVITFIIRYIDMKRVRIEPIEK